MGLFNSKFDRSDTEKIFTQIRLLLDRDSIIDPAVEKKKLVDLVLSSEDKGIEAFIQGFSDCFAMRAHDFFPILLCAQEIAKKTKNEKIFDLIEKVVMEGSDLVTGSPKPPSWFPTLETDIVGGGKFGWSDGTWIDLAHVGAEFIRDNLSLLPMDQQTIHQKNLKTICIYRAEKWKAVKSRAANPSFVETEIKYWEEILNNPGSKEAKIPNSTVLKDLETNPPTQEKKQSQSNPESSSFKVGYLVIIAILSIVCLGLLISFAVLPSTQGPASPPISNLQFPMATPDNSKIQSTYAVVAPTQATKVASVNVMPTPLTSPTVDPIIGNWLYGSLQDSVSPHDYYEIHSDGTYFEDLRASATDTYITSGTWISRGNNSYSMINHQGSSKPINYDPAYNTLYYTYLPWVLVQTWKPTSTDVTILPAMQGSAPPIISNQTIAAVKSDSSKIQSTYEVVGNVYGISDDGIKFDKVAFSLSKKKAYMLAEPSMAHIRWSTNNVPPYTLQYSSRAQQNPGQWTIQDQSLSNGEIIYDLILYPIVPLSPTETMTVEILPANGLPLTITKNALGKVSGKLTLLI